MRRGFNRLLMLLLLLLTIAGMKNADALARNCQSISLRYRQPLAADTVETALEKQPGLTFWCEDSALCTATWRQVQSTVLYYRGDCSLVLGKDCHIGQLPAPLDTQGCAISSALAWELFGSEDAVGLVLSLESDDYTVRGIFPCEDCLALLPVQDAAFTAVELAYTEEARQDPFVWVDALQLSSGLPASDWQLYTAAPAALGRALAWLPLAFAGLALFIALANTATRWPFPARDIAVFTAALAAALAFPWILSATPSWLVPSRWSDFSWWLQTALKIAEQFKAFLIAPGMGRDLAIKSRLLGQVGLAFVQCVLCETLRCRLGRIGHSDREKEQFTNASCF